MDLQTATHVLDVVFGEAFGNVVWRTRSGCLGSAACQSSSSGRELASAGVAATRSILEGIIAGYVSFTYRPRENAVSELTECLLGPTCCCAVGFCSPI